MLLWAPAPILSSKGLSAGSNSPSELLHRLVHMIWQRSATPGAEGGMVHAQANRAPAAPQLMPLALEDTAGLCAAWLAATASEAQPALGQLLGSCGTPEQLAGAEAELRAALAAWRHLAPAQDTARGVCLGPLG